jgi:hypothetical protein
MPPAVAALATVAGAAITLLSTTLTLTAAYVQTPASGDGWFDGRATFFGAPKEFADSFKDRGEGAFGDLLWGSCGYFNKPQVCMWDRGGRGKARTRVLQRERRKARQTKGSSSTARAV